MIENPYEAPTTETEFSCYRNKYNMDMTVAWMYRGLMFGAGLAGFILFFYFRDLKGAEITASIGIIGSLADIITCLIVEKLNESQRRTDIGS